MLSFVTIAAAPVRYWWVAPLATFLVTVPAVGLAFWVSWSSLREQRRGLKDNRRLRVHDDVREVLAHALRDLHDLSLALSGAQEILTVNKARRRVGEELGRAGVIPQERVNDLRRELGQLDETVKAHRRRCRDADSSINLQAERLRLLLGYSHPILDVIDVIVLNLSVESLALWKLAIHAPEAEAAQAAQSATNELFEFIDFVDNARSDVTFAGHRYVSGVQGS